MNGRGSRKDGKSGRPKVVRKSDPDSYRDGGLKSEKQDSTPDSYRDDILHSELNKSDPDNYRDEIPTAEIKS